MQFFISNLLISKLLLTQFGESLCGEWLDTQVFSEKIINIIKNVYKNNKQFVTIYGKFTEWRQACILPLTLFNIFLTIIYSQKKNFINKRRTFKIMLRSLKDLTIKTQNINKLGNIKEKPSNLHKTNYFVVNVLL